MHIELVEGQHLALSKKNKKKGITTFEEWVKCFLVYANTLCAYNPQRGPDMLGYLFIIASGLHEYSLPAVLSYDLAFRRKAAQYKVTTWGQIDPQLYTKGL